MKHTDRIKVGDYVYRKDGHPFDAQWKGPKGYFYVGKVKYIYNGVCHIYSGVDVFKEPNREIGWVRESELSVVKAGSVKPGEYLDDDRAVNNPEHYSHNRKGVECIEAIEASMSEEEFKGYLKGNVLKYMWRYSYKGKPTEDLKKARWYHDRLMERVEKEA